MEENKKSLRNVVTESVISIAVWMGMASVTTVAVKATSDCYDRFKCNRAAKAAQKAFDEMMEDDE